MLEALSAALESLSGVNARVQNLEDNFMLSGKEFYSEPSKEPQCGMHESSTPGLETALRQLGSLNARVEHISGGRPTTALLHSDISGDIGTVPGSPGIARLRQALRAWSPDHRPRNDAIHSRRSSPVDAKFSRPKVTSASAGAAQLILNGSDEEVQEMLREQQSAQAASQHDVTACGVGALHHEARSIGHRQLDALFDEDGGSAQVIGGVPGEGWSSSIRGCTPSRTASSACGAGIPHTVHRFCMITWCITPARTPGADAPAARRPWSQRRAT